MITIENIHNTDTDIDFDTIKLSNDTILEFTNVDNLNKFPYDKFPYLDTISVAYGVTKFNLEELRNCEHLKFIEINNTTYNRCITILGKLPSSVVKSFSDQGWIELLRYRPDLYKQIPSVMFDDPDFQSYSVRAVINGMQSRIKLIPEDKQLDQLSRDKGLMEEIKYKIKIEKDKRKINDSQHSRILDTYKQYETELSEL